MKKILSSIVVLALAALAYSQTTAPNAPLLLNPMFTNNGKLKMSITTGDTLTVLTCKKDAPSKYIPSGAFTYRIKSFDNGTWKGTATFASQEDSCSKKKTASKKTSVRLPATALYSSSYPVTGDSTAAMVYSKRIYFYRNGKKQFPVIILPVTVTEVLSCKAMEEILAQNFISAILAGNGSIVAIE